MTSVDQNQSVEAQLREASECFDEPRIEIIEDDDETNNTEVINEDDESGWVDILGSGALMKQVVEVGQEDDSPQQGDRCEIQYSLSIDDKMMINDEQASIRLGERDVCGALDIAISTMKLGETCRVRTSPRFDQRWEDKGQSLDYKITLMSFKDGTDELSSLESRIQLAQEKKENGGSKFRVKDYQGAFECYTRAIRFLVGDDDSEQQELDNHQAELILAICYSNASQCCLHLENWKEALKLADNALNVFIKLDDTKPELKNKAYYRKTKALLGLKEYQACIDLCNSVQIQDLQPVLIEAKSHLSKQSLEQNEMFKKMSKGITSDVDDNSETNQNHLNLNWIQENWTLVLAIIVGLFSIIIAAKLFF